MMRVERGCPRYRYGSSMKPVDHEQILSDDDLLSLWVGRVARTLALLEYNVDNVHRFLTRQVGDVGGSKSVKGFDQLINECRKVLRDSDAGQEIVMSGNMALVAAREATNLRNRVGAQGGECYCSAREYRHTRPTRSRRSPRRRRPSRRSHCIRRPGSGKLAWKRGCDHLGSATTCGRPRRPLRCPSIPFRQDR